MPLPENDRWGPGPPVIETTRGESSNDKVRWGKFPSGYAMKEPTLPGSREGQAIKFKILRTALLTPSYSVAVGFSWLVRLRLAAAVLIGNPKGQP